MTYEWREAPKADFAVLGDPVEHSLSPEMWTAAFRWFGLPYRYVKLRVPPSELDAALEHLSALGYLGVNGTVPHKEALAAWCRLVSPDAALAGAVNTVRLIDRQGWLTDVDGFRESIDGPTGPVLLLGAGGTARAAAVALSGREWAVWNRTSEKAALLANEFGGREIADPDPAAFAVVANLTSASLANDSPPLRWDRLKEGTLCVDAAYRRDGTLTPFLAEAEAHGSFTRDGRIMLASQGAAAFQILVPKGRDVSGRSVSYSRNSTSLAMRTALGLPSSGDEAP